MVVLTNDNLVVIPKTSTLYLVRGEKLGSLCCKRLDKTPVINDMMVFTATVVVTRDWIQIMHTKFGRAKVVHPA